MSKASLLRGLPLWYEDRMTLHCDRCGSDIIEGDKYVELFGKVICMGCIDDHTRVNEEDW